MLSDTAVHASALPKKNRHNKRCMPLDAFAFLMSVPWKPTNTFPRYANSHRSTTKIKALSSGNTIFTAATFSCVRNCRALITVIGRRTRNPNNDFGPQGKRIRQEMVRRPSTSADKGRGCAQELTSRTGLKRRCRSISSQRFITASLTPPISARSVQGKTNRKPGKFAFVIALSGSGDSLFCRCVFALKAGKPLDINGLCLRNSVGRSLRNKAIAERERMLLIV